MARLTRTQVDTLQDVIRRVQSTPGFIKDKHQEEAYRRWADTWVVWPLQHMLRADKEKRQCSSAS